jgi:hypothetical protein
LFSFAQSELGCSNHAGEVQVELEIFSR